jgi:shikimate kinase
LRLLFAHHPNATSKGTRRKETTMPAAKSKPTQHPAPTLPASLQRVVLTGFMGAGKTSVGRILADLLGWEFLDLDTHLERRAGASIADLFAQHGEPHFRRLESSALANALARPRTILALGGGTPEQLTNRLLLEQTPGTLIIFLDAPFETLFDRCMLQSFASPDHIRPVLASPIEAEARFQARQPLYRRLARHTVETASLSPEEAAQQILSRLQR